MAMVRQLTEGELINGSTPEGMFIYLTVSFRKNKINNNIFYRSQKFNKIDASFYFSHYLIIWFVYLF